MGIRYTRNYSNEYQNQRHIVRMAGHRHTLKLEAALSKKDKRYVFAAADRLRKCGNALIDVMMKNYDQLVRTKKYRSIMRAYGGAKEANDAVLKKELGDKLADMREQYNVTWEFCRNKMIELKNLYKLNSHICLARAEEIWYGIEELLYYNGGRLRPMKRGDLPVLRAKRIGGGITVNRGKDGKLRFKFGKIHFTNIDKPKDKFVNDELAAILEYLKNPEANDKRAVDAYLKDGTLTDTYRPCFASLKCVIIRKKLRVYILLTVEGKPMRKYRKAYNSDGSFTYVLRHKYGTGNVGVDIGTQTIAYTSRTEVGLKNLAERGDTIQSREAKERRLRRAMDRSMRAMNPDNYNPDGRIKKGAKTWIRSKRYKKLGAKLKELNRIAAENRHYAINEEVNYLRELGDVFITELKNAAKEQKKARPQSKEELADPNVKNKPRKRFGKSIRNRAPGYFQARAKLVFESTGGRYIEVPVNFCASRYDHTADICIKKPLWQRIYPLSDGTVVQRDMYSSFLLFNADGSYTSIDKDRCDETFPAFYRKEEALIEEIKQSGKKVMNSGFHPYKMSNRNTA